MLEEKIIELISPSLQTIGYDVVQVNIYSDVKKRLQILIDKVDESIVSINDCEKASYQISAVLDVELDEVEKYILEVSSAGIDRPLVKLKDYTRFIGREAKLELIEAINEQKKIKGEIVAVNGNEIVLCSDLNNTIISKTREDMSIDFDNIKKARLLLSSDLTKKNNKK